MRRVSRGHAHREVGGPSPLGPAGTPLVPALTHSTSGAVTGSNARLGTSKDLSSGYETPYRHFRAGDTHHIDIARCSDYRCSTRIRHDYIIPGGSLEHLEGVRGYTPGDHDRAIERLDIPKKLRSPVTICRFYGDQTAACLTGNNGVIPRVRKFSEGRERDGGPVL